MWVLRLIKRMYLGSSFPLTITETIKKHGCEIQKEYLANILKKHNYENETGNMRNLLSVLHVVWSLFCYFCYVVIKNPIQILLSLLALIILQSLLPQIRLKTKNIPVVLCFLCSFSWSAVLKLQNVFSFSPANPANVSVCPHFPFCYSSLLCSFYLF